MDGVFYHTKKYAFFLLTLQAFHSCNFSSLYFLPLGPIGCPLSFPRSFIPKMKWKSSNKIIIKS